MFPGQHFNVSVNITNVDASKRLIALQFDLNYSTTIPTHLQVLSVTEGQFLRSFDEGMGTVFVVVGTQPDVLVADMLLPNATGDYNEPFPSGSGIIATITFNVTSLTTPLYTAIPLHFEATQTLWMSIDASGAASLWSFAALHDGSVKCVLFGDLNGDTVVDITDVAVAEGAFGSYPGHSGWNPVADVDQDNKIDIMDVAMVSSRFGHHYP